MVVVLVVIARLPFVPINDTTGDYGQNSDYHQPRNVPNMLHGQSPDARIASIMCPRFFHSILGGHTMERYRGKISRPLLPEPRSPVMSDGSNSHVTSYKKRAVITFDVDAEQVSIISVFYGASHLYLQNSVQ